MFAVSIKRVASWSCAINVPERMTKAAACARRNFQEKREILCGEWAQLEAEIEMHFLGIVSTNCTQNWSVLAVTHLGAP
jgi:hypothetical protein